MPPSHTRPPRSTADHRDAASSAIFARIHAAGNSGNVLNNTFDGNDGTKDVDGGPLLRILGATRGAFTIKYNYFKKPYADMINMGNGTPGVTQSFDVRFNLLQDSGMGIDQQGHPDFVQSFWANASSIVVLFNTIFQSVRPAQGGTQGLGISSEVRGAVQRHVEVSNNTFIALPFDLRGTGFEGVYPGLSLARGQIDGTALVSRNYVDQRGFISVNGSPMRWLAVFPPPQGGTLNGKVICSENKNMITGATIRC